MTTSSSPLIAEWSLPPNTTLGSSVRSFSIELEIRRRLPWPVRKFVHVQGNVVHLRMPPDGMELFTSTSQQVEKAMEGSATWPVLPSELEDILGISSRERHKWMKAGRLQSAGTRTIKLRGRAKAVTFHVFDPQHIEDVLDRDLPAIWREEDADASSDNRRRAAAKARLTRQRKGKRYDDGASEDADPGVELEGWDAFAAEDLLR